MKFARNDLVLVTHVAWMMDQPYVGQIGTIAGASRQLEEGVFRWSVLLNGETLSVPEEFLRKIDPPQGVDWDWRELLTDRPVEEPA